MIWVKTLRTLIIFLVLVALYAGDRWWTARRRASTEMSERAIPAKKEDVTEATLVTPREILTLKKEKDDRWELTQPLKSPADKDAIEVLLGNVLPAMRYGEFKMDAGVKLEDYGLDAPQYKLMVRTKEAPDGLTLLVGKQAAESGKFYAKLESEDKIFSISEYIKNNLDKKPFDFRDRGLLPVTVENVRQVALTADIKKIIEVKSVEGGTTKTTTGWETEGPKKLVFVRTDGGAWRLEQPVNWKGDPTEIENFLRKLKTDKVTSFIDQPSSTTNYGFSKPQIDLLVRESSPTTGATQPVTLTLLVGDRETTPTRDFYAKRGDGTLVTISQATFDGLALNPSKLRDKQLFALDPSTIGKIDIETLRGKVQLVRNGQGRWAFADDAATSVDQQLVNDKLSALVDLRAKDFETDDATDLAQYKLDKPYVRLTVADKATSKSESLAIGDLATRNNESVVFARVGDSKTVALLDFTKPSEFALDKESLREKSLFAYDVKAVLGVEARRAGTTFTLTREGETWRILRARDKAPRQVSDFTVDDLVRSVRDLKYKDLYKGTLSDKEMGLTSPTLELVFKGANGAELARVIRGLEKGDRYYTRVKAGGPIYGVESAGFKPVDSAVDNLLKEE